MSGKKECTEEERLDEYIRTLDEVSQKVFAIFEESELSADGMIDFLVMTLANMCMFAGDPKKAAKELSRELSETVKQMIKSGYGLDIIKEYESATKEKKDTK